MLWHLTMSDDIYRQTFDTLPAEHPIGWASSGSPLPVIVRDSAGRDHSGELFAVRRGELVTRRPIIPIMMTTSVRAALEDCLFYVVREVSNDPPSS